MWVKVDYLLVLSEWLYEHQFPVEEVLSHLQWTLTLLLDQGGEEKQEEGEREEEGGGKEERSRSECGVCTWEKVVQILVRMARLQSRGGDGHRESCLAALAHCCLIWKVRSQSLRPPLCQCGLPSGLRPHWNHLASLCPERATQHSRHQYRSGLTSPLLTRYLLTSTYIHTTESTCVCS